MEPVSQNRCFRKIIHWKWNRFTAGILESLNWIDQNEVNCLSLRGVDADSDHFLDRAKNLESETHPLRWNKEALVQDNNKFVNEIDKRLENIDKTEVNDYWNAIKEGIIRQLEGNGTK